MFTKLALVFLCFSYAFAQNTGVKCSKDVKCLEDQVVNAIGEFSQDSAIPVLGRFAVLEKTGSAEARKDGDIVDKVATFFSNYKLNLKVPTSENDLKAIVAESRSSKLKKIILPLLLLIKLKAAIIIPAVISAIALVAFKGLGASLIALAISGATALKSLLENHSHSKFTYEVVPPIPHSHWSRSGMSGIENYPVPGYHTIQPLY